MALAPVPPFSISKTLGTTSKNSFPSSKNKCDFVLFFAK
jgi:hypothetical protein